MVVDPSLSSPNGERPGGNASVLTGAPTGVIENASVVQLPRPADNRLQVALQLAQDGYFLVPVTIRRVRKLDGQGRERIVKSPDFHKGWKFGGSRDPLDIKDWFVEHDCSFAIHHESSGTEAVDLDPKDGGLESWAALGLPGSVHQAFTPSTGVHFYWRRGGQGIGTNAGKLARGVDARSVGGVTFAPGSIVLGLDGQPEAARYTGTLPPVAELDPTPDPVVAAFAAHQREQRPDSGAVTVHDYAWAVEQFRTQLARVRAFDPKTQTGFRELIMGAAMLIGRGSVLWPVERIAQRLEQAAADVWGNADDDDREWIRRGIVDGLARERWELTGVPAQGAVEVPDEDRPTPEQLGELRRASKLAEEIERQQLRAEAARAVAQAGMAPLRALDFGAFLDAPMPTWLVPGFLYRASTAKVYGPPGGTKSFLLLDLALHLAAGRTWHGRRLERTRVHYVMAEGQAVNALRARAWLQHHGLGRDQLAEWFTAIPQGVLLTPEGIARYLELADDHRPGLIILDTKNRMMVGEENSATDVAVMVRAMDALREVSDACVTLVDHTGLTDQTRGRGSNAVTAAMDTEVRVSHEDGVGTATVTRDKAGQDGLAVSYRLQAVEDVDRPPGIAAPAVCVPMSAKDVASDPFSRVEAWWDAARWPLPEDVLNVTGAGRHAVPLVALWARWATADRSGVGVSRPEAKRAIRELDSSKFSADSIERAWAQLVKIGRISSVTGNDVGRSEWVERPDDPAAR